MTSSGILHDVLGKANNPDMAPGVANALNTTGIGRCDRGGSPILARLGSLQSRISRAPSDVLRAQCLRYKVFFEEMRGAPSGSPKPGNPAIDCDLYDEICDHLIVEDTALPPEKQVIGTYRFAIEEHLHERGQGVGVDEFYSASEFDIEPMLARHPELTFMELGRSCVLPAYRTKRTIELVWAAIWAYVRDNGVDAMFGCASFPGTDPAGHALPLSFLYHHMRADTEWSVNALPGQAREMDMLPPEQIATKKALHALPPLIKGYVRLGAMFANHAVVDEQFGTTDVMVILPVNRINPRYVTYYGEDANRHRSGI